MTRKLLLIFSLIAAICTATFAQEGDKAQPQNTWNQCKKRFKCEKVAFITSEMKFTVEEAQKFWPIYNKYDAIFDSIGEARRQNYNRKESMKNFDQMPEAKAADIIQKSFDYDQEELNARREYHTELSKLFTQKQVLYYYHLEHEFRRQKLSDSKPIGNSFGKSFKEK